MPSSPDEIRGLMQGPKCGECGAPLVHKPDGLGERCINPECLKGVVGPMAVGPMAPLGGELLHSFTEEMRLGQERRSEINLLEGHLRVASATPDPRAREHITAALEIVERMSRRAHGLEPFVPYEDDRPTWEISDELLDDDAEYERALRLRRWLMAALLIMAAGIAALVLI